MLEKPCTKCGHTLPYEEFNRARRNKSGRRAECRKCQRMADQQYRKLPQAQVIKRAYAQSKRGREAARKSDRQRNAAPHRCKYKRIQVAKYRQRPQNAIKDRARDVVNNAIKAGTFQRGVECEYTHTGLCSGKLVAHHADYSQPLDIQWLCSKHDYDAHHDGLPVLN